MGDVRTNKNVVYWSDEKKMGMILNATMKPFMNILLFIC